MASKRGKSDGPPDEAPAETASQRVDKWLVFARIVKTRSIAQDLVETKKVRLNREKIDNPARNIRRGDVLTITYSSRVHVLKVLGFAERRGSPAEAQILYEDLGEPKPEAAGSPDVSEEAATAPEADIAPMIEPAGRERRDPVQRDKDRRAARRERARR
ncbi:RNA-binding S4 domain-containing protein [Fulvimarina endophytica]|uniref:RNA-binding S4 domain-containing protein n=1 Tax=Fulvimarina endophytica TaxID=2293836 RepID=A0A371X2V1_9HYPH|nr:RNA-binding S4 domain-containing protein [Fulvimarina endophytica]RFC63561.1 RNA-binding S4 domain-containing protein [Fulvimarina endophytica]